MEDKKVEHKKYTPEMCELVLTYMMEGMSEFEVAKNLAISYTTFRQYVVDIPEFAQAVKDGEALCRAWWEQQGRENLIIRERFTKFNNTLWTFNMKNRFKWTDQTEVTERREESLTLQFDLTKMSEKELNDLDKAAGGANVRQYLKLVK